MPGPAVARLLVSSGAALLMASIGAVTANAQSPSVQVGSSPAIKRLCLIKVGVTFEMQPGFVAPLITPLRIRTCREQRVKPLRRGRARGLTVFLRATPEAMTAAWFEGGRIVPVVLAPPPPTAPPSTRWLVMIPPTSGRLILSVFNLPRPIPGGVERSRFDWKLSVRRS